MWAGLRRLHFDSVSDSRGTPRLVGKLSEADGWCVAFPPFLSLFLSNAAALLQHEKASRGAISHLCSFPPHTALMSFHVYLEKSGDDYWMARLQGRLQSTPIRRTLAVMVVVAAVRGEQKEKKNKRLDLPTAAAAAASPQRLRVKSVSASQRVSLTRQLCTREPSARQRPSRLQLPLLGAMPNMKSVCLQVAASESVEWS